MTVPAASPAATSRRSAAPHALLAVAGGLAWSLCFGRQASLWLPWVALVPLVLLIAGRGNDRRGFLWGWFHGTVAWLGSVTWVAATIETYGGLPRPLSIALLGLMALYLGLGHGIFVYFGRRIWRRGGGTALWALPALWVALEWLRGFAFGRFPWNLAAYAWTDLPGALPLAAVVGAYGVSYLVLFANVALARACIGGRRRRWELAVLAVLLPLLVLGFAGRFSPETVRGAAREVRVVQPNSPIVSTAAAAGDNYRRLIALSEAECRGSAPGGVLLIWPESAAWPWSYETSAHLRRDVARLGALGCEVILGSDVADGREHFNSALLVSGGAERGAYRKRKLVPWGEYVPLGDLFPFIGQLARQAGSFSPGDSVALLPWGEDRIGVAICYEIIFGGAVAEQVRAGATVLVTITNDAWYGDTSAPWQHFRAARFRAAENRRPVLRAALTGVSGLIDARGRVVAELGVGEEGVLRGRVTGSSELTPYSRAPWLVPFLAAFLAAFAIVRTCYNKDLRADTAAGAPHGRPDTTPETSEDLDR